MVWDLSLVGAMFVKTRSIAVGIGIGNFKVEDDSGVVLETSFSSRMSQSSVCSMIAPSLTFSRPGLLLPFVS